MIELPEKDRELIKAMGEKGRFFTLLQEQSGQFDGNRPSDWPAFAGYLEARMYNLLMYVRQHEESKCPE